MENKKKLLTDDLFKKLALQFNTDLDNLQYSEEEPYIHQRLGLYYLLRSIYPKHIVNQKFSYTEIKFAHVKSRYIDKYWETLAEDNAPRETIHAVVSDIVKQFVYSCGYTYEQFAEGKNEATTKIRMLLYINLVGLIPEEELCPMLFRDKYYCATYYNRIYPHHVHKSPKRVKLMEQKLKEITQKNIDAYYANKK